MRTVSLLLCCALGVSAGTETKAKPSEYPVSVETKPGFWVAADFNGHTFFAAGTSFLAEDFICIEVALFPPILDKSYTIAIEKFSLRLNKKTPILPQSPGFVAASLKYSDYDFRPTLEGQAGPVIVGPRPQSRFPGDPSDRTNRIPAPAGTDPAAASGADREKPANPAQLAVQVGIEEGPAQAAKSGYLYFPYRGTLRKLKSIELLYGDAVLKLR